MRKSLFIMIICILSSCQFNETELFEENPIIHTDTINIERIKIPTH